MTAQIYTSRNHPNLVEALIHAYFQMLGYPHTLCVLLELLGKSNEEAIDNRAESVWDSMVMLPERYLCGYNTGANFYLE